VNVKQELLSRGRAVFDSWEELLTSESEEEITAQRLAEGWSIKDVIAHLRAWQQISIARLEAAVLDTRPVFPTWLAGSDPFFAEDHTDDLNARIYELTLDQPWSIVHRAWKDGYQRFLDLAEAIPEKEMFDAQRYAWLNGYALSAVVEGSCAHHQEHFGDLAPRLE
jgi:hypothetical protein